LSISARTNSPAWVEADLPSRLSSRAFAIVRLSGMVVPPVILWNNARIGRLIRRLRRAAEGVTV